MIDFVLTQINLHNFVRYKDETIKFPHNKDKNIFLFKMRNGTGKTSLFHAIKWGFYGEKNIRFFKDSKEVFMNEFLNDRLDKKEEFYVEILFKYNNDRYTLKRKFNPKLNNKESILELTRNERDTFENNDASEKLSNILPPNFADFFMFDGEQLSRFMTAQSKLHRDSVEQLLGLRQLRILLEDLENINSSYEKELMECNSTNSRTNQIKKEVEILKREIETYKIKIADHNKKIGQNEKDIDVYEKNREGYSNQYEIQNSLMDLKDKREKISTKLTNLKTNLITNAESLFLHFIKSDLNTLRKQNDSKLKELENVCGLTDQEAITLSEKEKLLAKSIPKCDVCGHSLNEQEKKEIKGEITDIKNKLDIFKKNKDERDMLKEENYIFLQKLNELGNYDFIVGLDSISEECQKLTDIQKKIEELEEKSRGKQFGNFAIISRNIEELKCENTGLKDKISLSQIQMDKRDEIKNKKLKEIRVLGHDSDQHKNLSDKQEYVSNLITNIKKALELGKESKRKQIIDESNRMFLKITNNPEEYAGIEFEDEEKYSFVIRTKDGRIVTNPSKGEKQVLAMSFLLGLSQYTSRNNVIVMDTPITSLDDIHAVGIGDALAKLNNQVIFLAQPQELSEKIYDKLKKAIAKEYNGIREDYITKIRCEE